MSWSCDGDLSEMYSASRPMMAELGFCPLVTLIRINGREWMDEGWSHFMVSLHVAAQKE